MTSLSARVVSAVLTLVLSGTPAVLAACAALCLPGMSHTAVSASDLPQTAALAGESQLQAAHAHHHGPADPAPASPAPSPSGLERADSHACCPDTVAAPALSVAIVRGDARLAPALASVPYAVTRVVLSAPNVHAHHAVSGAPPRPRTPLVLRI